MCREQPVQPPRSMEGLEEVQPRDTGSCQAGGAQRVHIPTRMGLSAQGSGAGRSAVRWDLGHHGSAQRCLAEG